MSLREIIDQRIEFEPHPQCPACGCMEAYFDFRFERSLRSGDGSLNLDARHIGGEPDPHLIITCSRCGLQREMETYR